MSKGRYEYLRSFLCNSQAFIARLTVSSIAQSSSPASEERCDFLACLFGVAAYALQSWTSIVPRLLHVLASALKCRSGVSPCLFSMLSNLFASFLHVLASIPSCALHGRSCLSPQPLGVLGHALQGRPCPSPQVLRLFPCLLKGGPRFADLSLHVPPRRANPFAHTIVTKHGIAGADARQTETGDARRRETGRRHAPGAHALRPRKGAARGDRADRGLDAGGGGGGPHAPRTEADPAEDGRNQQRAAEEGEADRDADRFPGMLLDPESDVLEAP